MAFASDLPDAPRIKDGAKGNRPVPTTNYGAVRVPSGDRSGELEAKAKQFDQGARDSRAQAAAASGPLQDLALGVTAGAELLKVADTLTQEFVKEDVRDTVQKHQEDFFGVEPQSAQGPFDGAPEGLQNEVASLKNLAAASATRRQVPGHFEARMLASMRATQRKWPGWADIVEKEFISHTGSNPATAMVKAAQKEFQYQRSQADAEQKAYETRLAAISKLNPYTEDEDGDGVPELGLVSDPEIQERIARSPELTARYTMHANKLKHKAAAIDDLAKIHGAKSEAVAKAADAVIMETVVNPTNSDITSSLTGGLDDTPSEEASLPASVKTTPQLIAEAQEVRRKWTDATSGGVRSAGAVPLKEIQADAALLRTNIKMFEGQLRQHALSSFPDSYTGEKGAKRLDDLVAQAVAYPMAVVDALQKGDTTGVGAYAEINTLDQSLAQSEWSALEPGIIQLERAAREANKGDEIGFQASWREALSWVWGSDAAKVRSFKDAFTVMAWKNELSEPPTIAKTIESPEIQSSFDGRDALTGKPTTSKEGGSIKDAPLHAAQLQVDMAQFTEDQKTVDRVITRISDTPNDKMYQRLRAPERVDYFNMMTSEKTFKLAQRASPKAAAVYATWIKRNFPILFASELQDMQEGIDLYETHEAFVENGEFFFKERKSGDRSGRTGIDREILKFQDNWEKGTKTRQEGTAHILNTHIRRMKTIFGTLGSNNPDMHVNEIFSSTWGQQRHPEMDDRARGFWNQLGEAYRAATTKEPEGSSTKAKTN